jgi:multidrug efflux pump subunit AcrA (membrane-fusion protein)
VISSAGQSAQAVAVINAWYPKEQRKAELQSATQAYNQALGAEQAACSAFSFLEAKYNDQIGNKSFVGRNADGDEASDRYSAFWENVKVAIDQTYRQGRLIETINFFNQRVYYYEIERWGYNPAACTAAGVDLATAAAALTTAQNNFNSAESTLSAAIAALPANDPLRLEDVCGKRVSSCTLHFPEQSLPFGGFPGANVTRS